MWVLSVYTPFPQPSSRVQVRPVQPHSVSLVVSSWFEAGPMQSHPHMLSAPLGVGLGCSPCRVECRGGPESLFTASALPPPLFPKDRGQGTGGRWPVVDSAQNSCWGQAHTLPVPCRDSGSLRWRSRKTRSKEPCVREGETSTCACSHALCAQCLSDYNRGLPAPEGAPE